MNTLRCFAVALAPLLLGACATSVHNQQQAEARMEADDVRQTQQKEKQLHTSLIRDMLARGQYYAALAHIEDEEHGGNQSDEVHLLEADARRHLNQTRQARALYQPLLLGKLGGAAYHGLGLMDAEHGQLQQGITELRRAAALEPTDVEIRNDLGFALMQTGDYNAAMPELSTAAELAPDQLRTRKNLVILMFLMGNEIAAQQLAQRSGLDAVTVTRLRADAQQIKLTAKRGG